MLILYQFPISHYCEKARWALDYKNLDYQVTNLLPGLHEKTTKKLAPRSSVPILAHDKKIIQGSGQIITYLDENFRVPFLTPDQVDLKAQALTLEGYIDKEIGIHVRRCLYHILLKHPNIVIPFLTKNGPWYGHYLIKFIFPKLNIRMRKLMTINAATAKESRMQLAIAIDKLNSHLQNHEFLVGNHFTRADLAAASLLAPLCMPTKYGLQWPQNLPDELEEFYDEFSDKIQWVNDLYQRYR